MKNHIPQLWGAEGAPFDGSAKRCPKGGAKRRPAAARSAAPRPTAREALRAGLLQSAYQQQHSMVKQEADKPHPRKPYRVDGISAQPFQIMKMLKK